MQHTFVCHIPQTSSSNSRPVELKLEAFDEQYSLQRGVADVPMGIVRLDLASVLTQQQEEMKPHGFLTQVSSTEKWFGMSEQVETVSEQEPPPQLLVKIEIEQMPLEGESTPEETKSADEEKMGEDEACYDQQWLAR